MHRQILSTNSMPSFHALTAGAPIAESHTRMRASCFSPHRPPAQQLPTAGPSLPSTSRRPQRASASTPPTHRRLWQNHVLHQAHQEAPPPQAPTALESPVLADLALPKAAPEAREQQRQGQQRQLQPCPWGEHSLAPRPRCMWQGQAESAGKHRRNLASAAASAAAKRVGSAEMRHRLRGLQHHHESVKALAMAVAPCMTSATELPPWETRGF